MRILFLDIDGVLNSVQSTIMFHRRWCEAGKPQGRMECKIKTREKSHSFDLAMWSDCWDKTIDPSPTGLWKRFLKKLGLIQNLT